MTGKRFGKLFVIGIDNNANKEKSGHAKWICRCDCGNIVSVLSNSLTMNKTKSCGCYKKEKCSEIHKKSNAYDLSGEYGVGYTSKGEEFYFDLEDYNKIANYGWIIMKTGYVVARKPHSRKNMYMHTLICDNNFTGLYVDHINGIKNDNRKCNLRIVTNSQNSMNAKIRSDNTSGVTGVSWNKLLEMWDANIVINNKTLHLGYSSDFDEAVVLRKNAEDKYFGEYSYANSRKGVI